MNQTGCLRIQQNKISREILQNSSRFLRYSTLKNVVTLKSRSKVSQSHRNWQGLIRQLQFPINVT